VQSTRHRRLRLSALHTKVRPARRSRLIDNAPPENDCSDIDDLPGSSLADDGMEFHDRAGDSDIAEQQPALQQGETAELTEAKIRIDDSPLSPPRPIDLPSAQTDEPEAAAVASLTTDEVLQEQLFGCGISRAHPTDSGSDRGEVDSSATSDSDCHIETNSGTDHDSSSETSESHSEMSTHLPDKRDSETKDVPTPNPNNWFPFPNGETTKLYYWFLQTPRVGSRRMTQLLRLLSEPDFNVAVLPKTFKAFRKAAKLIPRATVHYDTVPVTSQRRFKKKDGTIRSEEKHATRVSQSLVHLVRYSAISQIADRGQHLISRR